MGCSPSSLCCVFNRSSPSRHERKMSPMSRADTSAPETPKSAAKLSSDVCERALAMEFMVPERLAWPSPSLCAVRGVPLCREHRLPLKWPCSPLPSSKCPPAQNCDERAETDLMELEIRVGTNSGDAGQSMFPSAVSGSTRADGGRGKYGRASFPRGADGSASTPWVLPSPYAVRLAGLS